MTDQSRAQQRRRFDVREVVGNSKAVVRIGHRILRIAAVDLITREPRRIAEIFTAFPAVAAVAARVAEPWNADPLTRLEVCAGSQGRNMPHNLMAGDDRQLRLFEIAVDNMQVGTAHTTSGDLDQHLASAGHGNRHLKRAQLLTGSFHHHGFHEASHTHGSRRGINRAGFTHKLEKRLRNELFRRRAEEIAHALCLAGRPAVDVIHDLDVELDHAPHSFPFDGVSH